ncbi:MAG: sodium:proton antiporter [Paludibacteraceae bacterium]|nr:sodium:proton antiporter [Paludibacteraceae bacterium]
MEQIVHSIWGLLPFGLMLLIIAVAPLLTEHWWESNKHKLTIVLFIAIPTAVCLIMGGMLHEVEHQFFGDYIPFIVLLLSLYVITGGIHLSGDIAAKPWVNTLFLTIGWLLASIMGTTGAAMLLIRPLLTTNQQRKYKVHTVLFFIALVANCGGLLTPLGDPPLFMLFLRGASFTWFLSMLPQWLFVGVVLLGVYFVTDTYFYKREHYTAILADNTEHQPLKLMGKRNLVFLLGVIFTVAFVNSAYIPEMAIAESPVWLRYLREIILVILSIMSLVKTPHDVRYELNKFSWAPFVEVAVLFFGIFITMTPAIEYLNAHASELGLCGIGEFYYATGALSSFLDNTPTAVALHSVAQGLTPEQMAAFGGNTVAGIPEILLTAICIGAVFFGAMTYIGNGPNFMVKAIAEENGIKMPSFFGYIFTFSLIILLPIYILVHLIFL